MRTLLFSLCLWPVLINAQIDSTIAIPMVEIHFGGHLPGADLSERFGPNLNAGGSFMYKTKKNYLFGVESNYFFGRNVKEDVLVNMRGSGGFVIDNEGYPADLRVTERGIGIHLIAGKVFHVLSANPNSGLVFSLGAGYMQHKIHLYDAQQRVAAVSGDLKFGYDRLSNGISFSQFVGYLFMSENKMLNFFAGFEFYEGLTSSVRKLNYDTGLPDTKKRMDVLYGLRLGWVLPLYKKRPQEYYYN
ncbi:MAG: hypothetical protein IPM51_06030 [Sphingobacteriaceae bacterium]|nr:hypothetical protein [Sphingobacteriaceae bacterium]